MMNPLYSFNLASTLPTNWTSSDLPTYVQLLLTYLVESKATLKVFFSKKEYVRPAGSYSKFSYYEGSYSTTLSHVLSQRTVPYNKDFS